MNELLLPTNPKPYYHDADAGITIYQGDAREIVPQLTADSLITDPVWPNCEHVFPGIDAQQLLADTLAAAAVKTVVIQIGCGSDPRFLQAVPERFPFIRTCWLEYACPNYQGRILNTGDVAYAFGEPPPSAKGRHVLPGRFLSHKVDKGLTRWNWDDATHRKLGRDHFAELPHPTPRRLAHVKWLVNWFGQDSVIDPFMGSGTTARACKDLGKRFIGIELEECYCEIAVRRLQQAVLPLDGVA